MSTQKPNNGGREREIPTEPDPRQVNPPKSDDTDNTENLPKNPGTGSRSD